MTLFKQIALMLSLFLYIILTTVLILNFQSAKKSVKDRLYDDAKNTASSLSLSLGGAKGDLPMMSTMINANFDSGNYNKITLVDVDNTILYERKIEKQESDVPMWFANIIDIKAPVALANVSAGWSQVGILNVVGNATYAHKQLYTIFIDLVALFSIVLVLALLTLNYLVHIILRPLKEIQKQAAAIIRNEFIIQTKIPYTSEFKDVVVGMNNMITKVKAMFEKGNRELKAYKEQEYIDKETHLKNRKYLIDKLPEYLKVDASHRGGVHILIAIGGVIEANEKIGRQGVNKLFLEISQIFQKYADTFADSIVVRMGGTEFSILLPKCTLDDGISMAKEIQKYSLELFTDVTLDTKETFLNLGIYEYSHLSTVSEFLAASDDTLSHAKFDTSHIYGQKAEPSAEIMGRDEWRTTIAEAVKNSAFSLVFWKVLDTKDQKTLHSVLSIQLKGKNEKIFSYAQFMSHAIQAGFSFAIYQNIIDMLFTRQNSLKQGYTYALRLPKEYLEHQDTYKNLEEILGKYSSKAAFKLIIELPDKLVREDSKHIREYVELFRNYNIDIGIFEFIGEGNDYKYIQNLRPAYIKAESSYFLTQSDKSLSALRLITDTVGISLIAASVPNLEMLKELKEKDIHLVQGYVTELI